MIGFVALDPDGKPLGIYPDMRAAQEAIAEREPDIVAQGRYTIHPIREQRDADVLKLQVHISYVLEKRDLEGNLLEVITGEG